MTSILTNRHSRRKDTLYTRSQIEDLIAQGRHIVIVEGAVLKTDSWLPFHPGGDKALKHMVGRDATDEVSALHSKEARQRMESYIIGRYEGHWVNFVPPIRGGKFRTFAEQEADRISDTSSDVPVEDDNSSESEAPSPVFDSADAPLRLRRRKFQIDDDTPTRSLSQSSLSSLDIGPEQEQEEEVQKALDHAQTAIEADLAKYPSLDAPVQEEIIMKYRAMNDRIREAGLYNCNYAAYAREIFRYTLLFTMCCICLHYRWYMTAGVFLGAFWHQLVFTAHDAGHMGITHNYQTDTCLGIFVADFLGGLSLGWWKRSHNVHHVVTNLPEHDPDVQLMPFFAVTSCFFNSLTSTYYDKVMAYDAFAKRVVQYQHYLYYPILAFGRFNLYVLSWDYILIGRGPRKGPAKYHRYLEMAGQIFFWTWFGYGMLYRSIDTWFGRIAFVLISHMVTAPLHVQITLSHFAMSTSDLGAAESFPQKMLRTTMDVACPEWLDWFHGGLQFQAIHHLYPRIPRHNLRKAQGMVQEFCEDTGIPYALYGFGEGNGMVISRLGEVGRQARVLADCQAVCARKGVFHEH